MFEINKRKVVILAVCALALIPLFFLIKALCFPVIYPVKSASQELTIVLYSGFYPNRPVITLKHFIDERYIADYVLTIENRIHEQEPQTYALPVLEEGAVEVSIELGDRIDSSFTITYNQTADLFNEGMLIYLYTDFSNYTIVEGERVHEQTSSAVELAPEWRNGGEAA